MPSGPKIQQPVDPMEGARWGVCSPEYLTDSDQQVTGFNKQTITTVMKWVSTGIMMAAAIAIINDWRPATLWLLNLGNLSWLITSILWGEKSLIVVNASLMTVYGFGLVRTLF